MRQRWQLSENSMSHAELLLVRQHNCELSKMSLHFQIRFAYRRALRFRERAHRVVPTVRMIPQVATALATIRASACRANAAVMTLRLVSIRPVAAHAMFVVACRSFCSFHTHRVRLWARANVARTLTV